MNASKSTSLTLRLPASLRARLRAAAAADFRNESQFVRLHLAKLLAEKRQQKAAKPE